MTVAPLQDAFWRVCERLVYLHSTPWEMDEALVAWGYGMGPFEAQDLIGLDAVLTARRADQVTPVLARMVAEGRVGGAYDEAFARPAIRAFYVGHWALTMTLGTGFLVSAIKVFYFVIYFVNMKYGTLCFAIFCTFYFIFTIPVVLEVVRRIKN